MLYYTITDYVGYSAVTVYESIGNTGPQTPRIIDSFGCITKKEEKRIIRELRANGIKQQVGRHTFR
jgi:isopropylmalate/homocitrate/citramalate synthase